MAELDIYRKGGEGFIQWAEDYVNVSIYPKGSEMPVWTPLGNLPDDKFEDTGRSYKGMWEAQKDVMREALEMENGEFKHRLIALCWQRGQGKSFLVCLIAIWKWFCWPMQQIVLGANSKDQVTFVHYDEIKKIIHNSPKLLQMIGSKNVTKTGIVGRDEYGNVISSITPISAWTGVYSNISAFTFSEMFRMKNPAYFTELYGSIRVVPNALGLIDSTVSSKNHQLYKLYETFVEKKDPLVYFSYWCSQTGKQEDYIHPRMTNRELDSYRATFVLGGFERFFLNLWDSGAERAFSQEQVQAINYLGLNKSLGNHKALMEVIRKRNDFVDFREKLLDNGKLQDFDFTDQSRLDRFNEALWPVDSVYKLSRGISILSDLEKLSELFDSQWAILVGVDRADPMKKKTGARTIVSCLAKGLPGSRSRPYQDTNAEAPEYLYLVMGLFNIEDHSIKGIKDAIQVCHENFDGIDTLGTERYGMVDMVEWCNDLNIKTEVYHPTYNIQRSIFTEVYLSIDKGKFKSPYTEVPGMKEEDILQEEFKTFDHDEAGKWFGSPEKSQRKGVQDDSVYSIGAAMYGGRMLTVTDFRERSVKLTFAQLFPNKDLLGDW